MCGWHRLGQIQTSCQCLPTSGVRASSYRAKLYSSTASFMSNMNLSSLFCDILVIFPSKESQRSLPAIKNMRKFLRSCSFCRLSMNVDDSEVKTVKYEGKKRVMTSSPVYLGGVPNTYTILAENMRTSEQFAGCLGDVTINARFVVFNVLSGHTKYMRWGHRFCSAFSPSG